MGFCGLCDASWWCEYVNITQEKAFMPSLLSKRTPGSYRTTPANVRILVEGLSFSEVVCLRLTVRTVNSHQCVVMCVLLTSSATMDSRASESRAWNPTCLVHQSIILQAFTSVKITAFEITGIWRSNGKMPDGLTFGPWKLSLHLDWNATCATSPRYQEYTSNMPNLSHWCSLRPLL